MGFVGRKPTNAPLTSSDLGTGIVGSTNIADGAITESKLASGVNDDEDIKYDLATLALQQASDANKAAYALPNTFIDQFEDSTGIDVQTNTSRNTSSEYVSSLALVQSGWENIDLNQAYINAISGVSGGSGDFLGATELAAVGNLGTGNYTQVANTNIDQMAAVAPLTDLNTNIRFGTGYKWQIAQIQKNGYHQYQMGMSYNANLVDMTSLNGATTNTAQGTSAGGDSAIKNTVFGINYENAGGALRFNAGTGTTITTAGSITGDSGLYWDYDGDATTLKVTRWNLGSTSADSVLNQYLVNNQSIAGRILPSSGRPIFTFGHHNHNSTANQFQIWTKYSSGANSATGNFTSVSQTAQATVSKMGIVVLYKNNAGTATLNTDLIAQVSADNGSNYSTVTLTPRGTFSTGINIATAAAVSVTSGTSCKYKISFANQSSGSKDTQVYGVALQY